MNGVHFVLALGTFGALVYSGLRLREARRLGDQARETLNRAENHLVCAEEWCV